MRRRDHATQTPECTSLAHHPVAFISLACVVLVHPSVRGPADLARPDPWFVFFRHPPATSPPRCGPRVEAVAEPLTSSRWPSITDWIMDDLASTNYSRGRPPNETMERRRPARTDRQPSRADYAVIVCPTRVNTRPTTTITTTSSYVGARTTSWSRDRHRVSPLTAAATGRDLCHISPASKTSSSSTLLPLHIYHLLQ